MCRTYLHEALQKVVTGVIENSEEIDCEVDKERIQNGSILKDNQDKLMGTAYTAISRLKQVKSFFPNELREVYVRMRFYYFKILTRVRYCLRISILGKLEGTGVAMEPRGSHRTTCCR